MQKSIESKSISKHSTRKTWFNLDEESRSARQMLCFPRKKDNSLRLFPNSPQSVNKLQNLISSDVTIVIKEDENKDNLLKNKKLEILSQNTASRSESRKLLNKELIVKALGDPRWSFWTVEALAKETKISRDEVIKIIGEHKDIIRRSLVPSKEGVDMYTLRSNSPNFKEYLALARTLLSGSFN